MRATISNPLVELASFARDSVDYAKKDIAEDFHLDFDKKIKNILDTADKLYGLAVENPSSYMHRANNNKIFVNTPVNEDTLDDLSREYLKLWEPRRTERKDYYAEQYGESFMATIADVAAEASRVIKKQIKKQLKPPVTFNDEVDYCEYGKDGWVAKIADKAGQLPSSSSSSFSEDQNTSLSSASGKENIPNRT